LNLTTPVLVYYFSMNIMLILKIMCGSVSQYVATLFTADIIHSCLLIADRNKTEM